MEASPRINVLTSSGKVEAFIAAKGDQLHINAYDFGMRCSTSRCPHTVGHVVYVDYEVTMMVSHDMKV